MFGLIGRFTPCQVVPGSTLQNYQLQYNQQQKKNMQSIPFYWRKFLFFQLQKLNWLCHSQNWIEFFDDKMFQIWIDMYLNII